MTPLRNISGAATEYILKTEGKDVYSLYNENILKKL